MVLYAPSTRVPWCLCGFGDLASVTASLCLRRLEIKSERPFCFGSDCSPNHNVCGDHWSDNFRYDAVVQWGQAMGPQRQGHDSCIVAQVFCLLYTCPGQRSMQRWRCNLLFQDWVWNLGHSRYILECVLYASDCNSRMADETLQPPQSQDHRRSKIRQISQRIELEVVDFRRNRRSR